jgi:nucleotide-binding universal stress UspA family protein
MKTILVCINNPAESKEFITYCVQMARDLNKAVRLLHVFNPNNYPLGMPGSTGDDVQWINENIMRIMDDAKSAIEKTIHELKKEIHEIPFIDYSVETGYIADVLEDISGESYIDMIMLEENDARRDSMFGDADIDIIKHTECPVWIIPKNFNYHPYRSVVYATDYNEHDIDTMKKLVQLIRPYSPDITALHITDSLDFDERVKNVGFKDMLAKMIHYKKVDVKALAETDGKNIVESIDDYVDGNHIDLIVLLKENRHFLDRIFKVSNTKRMIRSSHQPVLVYHEKAEHN